LHYLHLTVYWFLFFFIPDTEPFFYQYVRYIDFCFSLYLIQDHFFYQYVRYIDFCFSLYLI
jgi:hypothetical protein